MHPRERRRQEEYERLMGEEALNRQIAAAQPDCTCGGRTSHSFQCPRGGRDLQAGKR